MATIHASKAKRAKRYLAREDGGAEVTIIATSTEQALSAAREWTAGGEYDPDNVGETVTQHVAVWLERDVRPGAPPLATASVTFPIR